MAGELMDKLKPVKLYFISSTPEICDETRPPIIFIHGFFTSNRTFTGVRYKISKRTKRKIYSIDLRNHGKSEFSDEFTINHLVADLENFMKEQNIPKAILAGHSKGGKVALAMALKYPEKVEKLIVEDIPLRATKAQNDKLIQNFHIMKALFRKLEDIPKELSIMEAQKLLVPFVAKYFPVAVNNFSSAKSDIMLPIHKNSDGNFEWEMNVKVISEVADHFERFDIDLSDDPIYNGETLLIAGGKSFLKVQDNLGDYYKHFPNIECRVIEKGFHTYHVEYPEIYIKFVTEFIDE